MTKRVLFLCTHNAARSQMAEGILRLLGGSAVEVESAGTEPSRVHPLAVRALADLGIGIGTQRSKHVDEVAGQRFDYVITLCDQAREVCPVFPGAPERIHWGFDDPAAVAGSDEERYEAFRRTARELTTRLRPFVALLGRDHTPSPA